MIKHIPVMIDDVMAMIGDVNNRHVIDATFGAGGYSRRFLDAGAYVIAFDRDPSVLSDAEQMKKDFGDRFRFIPEKFSHMANLHEAFDAIVFDLGISSMQIDNPERGFSFRTNAPLDMRMSSDGPTICDMFEQWTEPEIVRILRDFGDIAPATAIAKAIKQNMPKTTFELRDLIHNPRDVAPVFQALRIALNDEMGELIRAMVAVPGLLKSGGRCLCVTFHSIEDRIVKNTFRDWTSPHGDPHIPTLDIPKFKLLRVMTPSDAEIAANSRARSAHLRGVVKSC